MGGQRARVHLLQQLCPEGSPRGALVLPWWSCLVLSGGRPGSGDMGFCPQLGQLCGWCHGAQVWPPCSVPESLELSLPVMLLSDLQVTQSSLGTPKISISTFFPHFGRVTILDGDKK